MSLYRMLMRALVGLLSLCLAMPQNAAAQQQRVGLIRDAEIEDTIRAYAAPLFGAAGLDPSFVRIHLVNDPRLNAFVAGGQHLFLNTGLLMRSTRPNQVIGVIAHETGHIAGGHLARTQEALRNASIQSIIAFVLGLGAAVASGDGRAGAAVTLGGQSAAQRSFLQYSIAQESAADLAGLRFLEATGQSAVGTLEFLEILADQEALSATRQDPYLRTHPLSRQRIDSVRNHVAASRHSNVVDPPELMEKHRRMKAKLAGFIYPPARTLGDFKPDDRSVPARYARAIAYFRIPDLANALPLIEGLIADEPRNPYFHELKGQMLFENGRIREALAPYREAVRLAPGSALLRISLAQVMLELNDPAQNRPALAHLSEAIRSEDKHPLAWRLLAVAYGREGDIGQSALALSEEAMARNDFRTAAQQATRAMQILPTGSPGWLRADDIKRAAERERDRADNP